MRCFVVKRGEARDEDGLCELLAAPLGARDRLRSCRGAAGQVPAAREAVLSNSLRTHLIDGDALEAWRLWRSRLEPYWGRTPFVVVQHG